MKKRDKIIYWIATGWLALGMVSTALAQLLNMQNGNDFMFKLGYPTYVLTLLGIWKILGVIAVLIPRAPLLKEWAYAGFFFAMTGALFSHFAHGDGIGEMYQSSLLLALTIISWYFRPANKKLPLLVRNS